jgi:hypothetical protein
LQDARSLPGPVASERSRSAVTQYEGIDRLITHLLRRPTGFVHITLPKHVDCDEVLRDLASVVRYSPDDTISEVIVERFAAIGVPVARGMDSYHPAYHRFDLSFRPA